MNIECIFSNEQRTLALKNNESIEIPEGRYSLVLTGLIAANNYRMVINNKTIATLSGQSFYSTIVDTINHIGYGKLELFCQETKLFQGIFYTSTFKATKEEFYQMLDFVAANILWKDSQFIYYDKHQIRHRIVDPLFVFNWIANNFDFLEQLVTLIHRAAVKNSYQINKKSFVNTHYHKQKTLSYLRNNPDMISPATPGQGILETPWGSFNPQLVIAREAVYDYELNEHLQILELLNSVYQFLLSFDNIFRGNRYDALREKCKQEIQTKRWMNRITFLKNNTFLQHLSMSNIQHVRRHPLSPLQQTNHQYGQMYALYTNYISNHFDFLDQENSSFYQHIKNIDKIYEAFCCYLLAEILELKSEQNGLLATGIPFKNQRLKLYYQSKPSNLKGWAVADTPDIILKHANGRVIILDSKFKINQRDVKGEDIQKLQGYLNNYHETIGAVLYPGDSFSCIEDNLRHLYKILQIPIFPWLDGEKYQAIKKQVSTEIYKCLENGA